MLNKLMQGWKERNKKPESNDGGELLNKYKKQLTGIVYDEELAEQYAALFVKLKEHDPEGTLMELLESKEKQIQAIADGSAFKEESPESTGDVDGNNGNSEDDEEDYSVESLIVNRGK